MLFRASMSALPSRGAVVSTDGEHTASRINLLRETSLGHRLSQIALYVRWVRMYVSFVIR